MGALVAGLVLFLGVHSVRLVADPWRARMVAHWGLNPWKAAYSVVALLGFLLLVWGYGLARQAPVVLWTPPRGMNHLAALLTLLAFVLLAAAYMPGNAIRARLGHPMLLGVKLWALAHLLSNGTLADLVLFGSFLVWAIVTFRAARRRGDAVVPAASPRPGAATAATVLVGLAGWALFAFWAHAWLIGVRPLGT